MNKRLFVLICSVILFQYIYNDNPCVVDGETFTEPTKSLCNQRDGENLILDLLKRVTKITGPVTDWSGLRVTQGNMGAVLNGIVIGEEGKARVESILAGGYAIQRLHVRTLVKEIK